jgi:hypothetical protein
VRDHGCVVFDQPAKCRLFFLEPGQVFLYNPDVENTHHKEQDTVSGNPGTVQDWK